jgi:hypothetical protein
MCIYAVLNGGYQASCMLKISTLTNIATIADSTSTPLIFLKVARERVQQSSLSNY